MSTRVLLLPAVLATVVIGGCAADALQPPTYETAMKNYYEAHASEKNGRCKAPYIDGFTRVEVVEDTADQMVIEASYLYRDWLRDRDDTDNGRMINECVSFNSRRFVLDKSDGSLSVVEMSPPLRG